MKGNTFYFAIFFLMGILIYSPSFVYAQKTCYVDDNSNDNGDGSKEKPYDKILKAINSEYSKIKVQEGVYEESFTLKKSMKLEGDGSDKVIIEGKVTMSDNSEISELTINAGGIVVKSDSDVEIKNLKIKNSITGLEALGGGKLKVKDSIITSGGKGLYIRKGTEIEIINCEVCKNSEEGIDIRGNVSGNIIGNKIFENDESGIELILGKAKLVISENVIRKNSSSGITVQYYTNFNNLGDVNIKNNTIEKNKKYGIGCKAPSGSKGKPKNYWSQSVELSSNKILNNGEKKFASACKFAKSYEEISAGIETLEKKEDEKQINIEEKEELEKLKKEREKNAQIDLKNQRERDAKKYIDNIYNELNDLYQEDEILKEKIASRSSSWSFMVGSDYKSLKDISEHFNEYDEKINAIKEKSVEIADEEKLNNINEQMDATMEKRKIINSFIEKEEKRFSLLGWIFKRIYFL